MFTPSNQKKLTNVSIVTLKKYNKIYSIPVYPNKLYEYYNNITPLNDILISDTIYKNVQTGIKCSKEDLALFNLPHSEIIKEIVLTGHEQKNVITRDYERDMVECQIVDIVRKKVMKNKKFYTFEDMKQIIRNIYKIRVGDIKPQVLDILNILCREGYEKVKMRIFVEGKDIYIDSGDFIKFREKCRNNNIEYIVKKNIECNEEEIV